MAAEPVQVLQRGGAVPLLPVDTVEITTLYENIVDLGVPGGGPVERLRTPGSAVHLAAAGRGAEDAVRGRPRALAAGEGDPRRRHPLDPVRRWRQPARASSTTSIAWRSSRTSGRASCCRTGTGITCSG